MPQRTQSQILWQVAQPSGKMPRLHSVAWANGTGRYREQRRYAVGEVAGHASRRHAKRGGEKAGRWTCVRGMCGAA